MTVLWFKKKDELKLELVMYGSDVTGQKKGNGSGDRDDGEICYTWSLGVDTREMNRELIFFFY